MKTYFFILTFVFLVFIGYTQQSNPSNNGCLQNEITIGASTTVSLYLPFCYVYSHSYSQQIFTAEEIGISSGDMIESISIDISYIPGGMLFFNDQSIFLANTTKEHFLSTSDWIQHTEFTLVSSGTYTYTTVGWNKIEFDAPFVYEGGNLVVAALHNFGACYTCACPRFNASTTDGNRAIYYRVDAAPINPEILPAATGLLSNRSNVKFCYFSHNIDMCAISITGPPEVTVNETHNYTVSVKNNGLLVSNYTIEILTEANELIGQVVVMEPLEFNSIAIIEVPITFTEEMIGELSIKARVEVEGDEIPDNNETSTFVVTVKNETCETVNDLTSEKSSNNSVLLTWTEPESSLAVEGYRVYRNEELLTEELLTNTYYFDNELSNGVYEYYVITFYENECMSDSSNHAMEIISVEEPCEPVTDLRAEKLDDKTIFLSWTEPESSLEVEGYVVFRNSLLQNSVLLTDTAYLDENVPEGNYEYYVIAHYTNGCVADSSNHVTESVELGVKEVKKLEGVRVWPNPAFTTVTIEANNFNKVEVYNVFGQLLNISMEKIVDISTLNSGVYFLKIYTEKGMIVKKVIKN